jgi:hypothetical protein
LSITEEKDKELDVLCNDIEDDLSGWETDEEDGPN